LKGAVNKAGKVKETKESQDSLDIYCPKCKKKHVLHEFPLGATKLASPIILTKDILATVKHSQSLVL